MTTEGYAASLGKGFVCDVDVDWWQERESYKACVHIGEEYYESDPYKSQHLALCEVKGWLEGVKSKIEGTLEAINQQNNKQ